MLSLKETDPKQADFFLNLFDKARNAYSQDDYICVQELESTSFKDVCDHMDIEMVRLGFEFGRQFERLGVVV